MTQQFNAGDLVRVLTRGCKDQAHLVGKVATVAGYNNYGNVVLAEQHGLENGIAEASGAYEYRFKLYKAPQGTITGRTSCYAPNTSNTPKADTSVTSTGTDTATAAAIAIKPKKSSIKATILALLEQYPAGLTGEEIAQRGNLRLNSVTPRFAELSAHDTGLGAIKDSGTRRSGQIVWVLNK